MASVAGLRAVAVRVVVLALLVSTLAVASRPSPVLAGESPSFLLAGSGITAVARADTSTGGVSTPVQLNGPPVSPTRSSEGTVPSAEVRGSGFSPATREESQRLWDQVYEATDDGAIGWTGSTGSCTPGSTSVSFREGVLNRINYFRAMAGVPDDITLDPTYNAKAQAAALIMAANGDLSHDPPSHWDCFTADGHEGAGHSNLSLGAFGAGAVTGYMEDPGSANTPVGHRRWILYPQTQLMGTGDTPSSNALWVIDSHYSDLRPTTREEYVAWPPPGYVPTEVIFPRWSFSFPDADFADSVVTMTRNGSPVPVVLDAPHDGYGENTLVWEPAGRAHPGDVFQVTVSQVVAGGIPRTFTYEVTGFKAARQPDLRLRFGSGFIGNNVYDPTGRSQVVFRPGTAGATITQVVSAQNDGPESERFRIKGSRPSHGLGLRYFTDGTEITAQVAAGTYLTRSLAPRATQTIEVVATLTSTAPGNVWLSRFVTATSTVNTHRKDRVQLAYRRS